VRRRTANRLRPAIIEWMTERRRSTGRPGRGSPATAAGTSWDAVAGWYDGWVGSGGSAYHRTIAVPTVMELLDPRPDERILDVGAGQGVLAEPIARAGASYTGVDASPKLIEAANRRHRGVGRFLVGDARDLTATRGVEPGSFDAAVFLLSIQDMDPLDDIVRSVAATLAPRSRVVLLMTHPAFRQPRHAGWGYDEGRKLVYRRVDSYLTPMAVPMKALGSGPATRSFHRPISAYVNALAAVGFATDAMRELADLPAGSRPGKRTDAGRADAEIPLFLALRARRG
jgi:2-polyprenyl-3-methyl-5-hydroxy-6-metoxy-1,4-benzoquinol methylase